MIFLITRNFPLKSVELQKEMMEMQQQLKSYKEHVLEVEKTLEEKNRIAASYKEQVRNSLKVF